MTHLPSSQPFSESMVRTASSAEDIEAIERLRYAVYIQEMGKPLPWADHEARRLPDALDKGAIQLCTGPASSLTSALRLHLDPVPAEIRRKLELDQWCITKAVRCAFISKLMVSRPNRMGPLMHRLVSRVYQLARDEGISMGFCVCHPSLAPLYERIGLHRCGGAVWDEQLGEQVRMVLLLEDVMHFRDIGSMLFAQASRYPTSPARLSAFKNGLSLHTSPSPAINQEQPQ